MTKNELNNTKGVLVSVFGQKCLYFENIRLMDTVLPNDLYVYSLRHPDYDWSIPCELTEKNVLCNFLGTLISVEPIKDTQIDTDGYHNKQFNLGIYNENLDLAEMYDTPEWNNFYDNEWFLYDEEFEDETSTPEFTIQEYKERFKI